MKASRSRDYCYVLFVAMTATAFCQEPDRNPELPSFGSTTRLVQINVVAVGKDGVPVADLQKEDFQLLEDGRVQRLVHFALEKATPARHPPPASNEFSNQFTLRNSSRSGYSLILIDWLNSSLRTRMVSQQQVLKLLKQIELNDLVAVCVLDRGLRVLHDFTADRAELVNRIAAAEVALRDPPPGSPTALSLGETFFMSADDMAVAHMNRFYGGRRVLDTVQAFHQIASHLGSVPGRKSLIWVTSGFPSSFGYDIKAREERTDIDSWSQPMATDRRTFDKDLARAVQHLNNADIAVYPVDARGLLVGPGGRINVAVMNEVAARTGGRAFYDTNDLEKALRSALNDSLISYTLGYYPTHGGSDGKIHKVRVSVRRPGIDLRYREGYVATEGNGGKREKASEVELQQALESPLDATLLPLQAQAQRTGDLMDVRLRIDPATILLLQPNGRRLGKVSITFSFRPPDKTGRLQVATVSGNFDLTPQQYQVLLKGGMTFRKQLPIPPSVTSLRLVVREELSARIGSVTIPLSEIR